MGDTLDITFDGPVATVALDRPEVRNAFNATMIEELTAAFEAIGRRTDLRVVILRGNGRTFSAGADVQWMRASLDYSREENVADAGRMSDMFAALDGLPQALVGQIHGAALGGGMGLAAVCDIVIAADDAVFGFTETKLGIIPAVISRFVLPKLGASWARALFLSGERFDTALARHIGLVHWVVPVEDLDRTVSEKTAQLLSSGPEAVKAAKRLIVEMGETETGARRALTTERIAALRTTAEGQEGLRAFLEKRQPDWTVDTS